MKVEYEDALKKSGYNVDLKYTNNKSEKRKTRKRNIIWFNPPFSKSVSTNVAKTFLQLITKHFPRSHKLHKIFNRNTVKVSYSYMTNMLKIIKGHNKKVTSKPCDQRPKCNCRKKAECPIEGNCLANDVVYKCDVTRPLPKKVLDLQRENRWAVSITTSYHLNIRDIPTRQHFQVLCGTWKVFQVEQLA